MRWLTPTLSFFKKSHVQRTLMVGYILLAATAAFMLAQTAAPNAAGISAGHLHLVVEDPAAMQKLWVDVMGAQAVNAGPLTMAKMPGAFMIATKSKGGVLKGSKGSVADHVGFYVKSFADTKAKAIAAGLPVQEVTPNIQAFVTFPGDVIIEIQEDTSLTTPSTFSHFHLSVPDTNAAREWYIKTFGAEEGERRPKLKGAKVPGGFIDFLGAGGAGKGKGGKAPAEPPPPPAASKGRTLDHIGFEVKDLKAFTDGLSAKGQKLDVPVTDVKAKMGLQIAFLTDPDGTYIELTEGLNAK